MSVGFILLAHEALHRAEQVARHWAAAGCPVVIHVDKIVPNQEFDKFRENLSDLENVEFCSRFRCEWGTFGLVRAAQNASEMILSKFPEIRHVYLASGSCIPLRPVSELIEYLRSRPTTNFIESVTTQDVMWTIGGLDEERFTLRFPFSWKRNKKLFDGYVKLQRRLGFKRRIPHGLVPHLGSQWWCLTRQTLSAILEDPDRPVYDAYFSKVWIPDESYFQSLVRMYSTDIESRSLTLSKFDFQGKPHIFYDDHLNLLKRSDCFVARKAWPWADKLYESFLQPENGTMGRAEPNPAKIDRIFSKAVARRTAGRAGLYMHSRFPNENFEKGVTAAAYSVFEGFDHVFDDFEAWLGRTIEGKIHGHLFAPERAEFADRQKIFSGALSDCAKLRDYNPKSFLTNLLWSTRGERQTFQFGPRDNQGISWTLATDPNAHISMITGAWAIPLFKSNKNFSEIRREAARLQQREQAHLDILRSIHSKARVHIWSLAEFVEAPMEPLQSIIDEMGGADVKRLTEAPTMVDLQGFGQFLQNLKNQGMQPYLMGDFAARIDVDDTSDRKSRRPYLVK